MALTKIDDRGLKTPIDLLDNEKIRLGTGNDLELYHDGNNGNSHIKESGSGSLVLNADDLYLQNAAGTENLAVFKEDGAVELYHNNSKKFETTSTGVTVTGNVFPSANDSHALGGSSARWQELNISDVIDVSDSGKLRMGDSDDLQIYHSGANSVIDNTTGELQIATDAVMRFQATEYKFNNAANSEKIANFFQDGACELYHNHSKKFETTSSGVEVFGQLQMDDANSHIKIPDNARIDIGNSNDLQIYHDGSHTKLKNATGHIIINSDSLDINNAADNETLAKFDHDGAVELYHNGTKKLSTTADGICFNSDTAAANALDDYEEGTWTVSLLSGGSSITNQPANNRYVKIGSMVYITGEISSLVSPNSDILQIGGLPYAIAQGREGTGSCMSHHVTYGTNRTMITLYVYDNSSKFRFYSSGNATSWRAITGDDFSTSGDIIFSFAYHTV